MTSPGKELTSKYTRLELDEMISRGIERIELVILSGDGQKVSGSNLPSEAFVLEVKAENEAVIDFSFEVYQGERLLDIVFSDENGLVKYYASEKTRTTKGLNYLEFKPSLKLPSKFSRQMKRLSQKFVFKAEFASRNFNIRFDGLEAELSKRIIKYFSEVGIEHNPNASDDMLVELKVNLMQKVQGMKILVIFKLILKHK